MRNSLVASLFAAAVLLSLNGCGKIPTWKELTGEAKPPEPEPAKVVTPVAPAEPVQPQGPTAAQVIANFKAISGSQITDSVLLQLTSLDQGLDQITEINADQSKVTAAGLKSIEKLTNLQQLRLDAAPINDEACQYIGKAYSLKTLSICNTNVSAVGIAALTSLVNLNHLSIDNVNLSREAYAAIGTLPALVSVSLVTTNVDNRGFDLICNASSLIYLRLNSNPAIDDHALVSLKKLEKLAGLELSGSSINGVGLINAKKAGGLKNLHTLILNRCPIGLQGANAINDFKGLERLNLGEIPSMNDPGLKSVLVGLSKLKYLVLSKSPALDGSGLMPLMKHKELEEIYLDQCPRIGDGVVKILKTIKSLKTVVLAGTAVTQSGYSELKTALPDATIR